MMKYILALLQTILCLTLSAQLNLNWEQNGVDNVSTRIKTVHFDRVNFNTVWAGAVGGGLYKSTDLGLSWERVSSFDKNAVVRSIAQKSNGDMFIGTGDLYFSGDISSFNSNLKGNGIYLSTDSGVNWMHLPATTADSLSNTCSWCEVNDITVNPANESMIMVATRNGIKISLTGGIGNNWQAVSSPSFNGNVHAIKFSEDGQTVYASAHGRLYRNTDAVNNFISGWTQMNIPNGTSYESALSFDISKSNNNIIYALVVAPNMCMRGLYGTNDGGDTWTEILPGGPPYSKDPFNSPLASLNGCNGEGFYANSIAINPKDETKIYMGGITFYTYSSITGMLRADLLSIEGGMDDHFLFLPPYKHSLVFDPYDPSGNRLFICTEGGISICNNAKTGFPNQFDFKKRSNGLFNLHAYSIGAGKAGEFLLGTLGQGSVYVDGLQESPEAGTSLTNQNGIYTEISNLDHNTLFYGNNFGRLLKSKDRGSSSHAFIDDNIDRENCGFISCTSVNCSNNSSPYLTRFYLLETSNKSLPSITGKLTARNDTSILSPSISEVVQDTLYPSFTVTTIYRLENGVVIEENTVIDSMPEYMAISDVSPNVDYAVTVDSIILPGEHILYPDYFDAKYFVSSMCGLWMCINPIQHEEPIFYRISNASAQYTSMDASADGNHLFAINDNQLTIISGLNTINNSLPSGGCHSTSCTSGMLDIKVISLPGGISLEGVSVDKNDPNHVLVSSVSSASSDGYVFRVENALSNNPIIIPLQTNDFTLPYMSIFDCLIDYNNPDIYILGTEKGIWTSNNQGATWAQDITGMIQEMSVYRVRQEWLYENHCMVTYAATHGGGTYRTTSLMDGTCDPVPFQWWKIDSSIAQNISPIDTTGIQDWLNSTSTFKVYPNPGNNFINLEIDLTNNTEIDLFALNPLGQIVLEKKYTEIQKGINYIDLNIMNLTSGVYYFILRQNNKLIGNEIFIKDR